MSGVVTDCDKLLRRDLGFGSVELAKKRRSGRVAEGAPLLREYTLIAYRGFESLLLRHLNKNASLVEAFLFRRRIGEMRTQGSTNSAPGRVWTRSPQGGAPRRGESGEGSAARINPSFSTANLVAKLLLTHGLEKRARIALFSVEMSNSSTCCMLAKFLEVVAFHFHVRLPHLLS